jgi:hypothetical protein
MTTYFAGLRKTVGHQFRCYAPGKAVVLAALCLSLGSAGSVLANPVAALTEGNSSAQFDLGPAGVGMDHWLVEGIDRLVEQSFWYRVGDTPQQRVNTLNLSSWSVTADQTVLTVGYADSANRFTMQLRFVLTGLDWGSGVSDVEETVAVRNTSGAPLDFHLYEYVDIDLLGTAHPTDQSLSLLGNPVNTAEQSTGSDYVSETVVTPFPSRYEAGYVADLLSELTAESVCNLNDVPTAGDGDLAWAFQWDTTIGINKTFLVSKDKPIDTPEPSTGVLLGIAAVWLLSDRWRWRRRTA